MKSNEIKILHIVTGLDDGGLEKVVYMIVAGVKHSRIKHFVAVLLKDKNNSFLIDDFYKQGVMISYFNFDNRFNNIYSIANNIPELFKLGSFIKKNKIDIIHSHDFFPAFIARISALFSFIFSFFKIKRIFITLHNSFFWLNGFHHYLNRILSIITTKIICVSNSVMDYSMMNDKIKRNKYQIICNGVNIEQYFPDVNSVHHYRNELFINSGEIVLGNVGVLSIRKGQKYLIEAFRRLLPKYPNLKLLIFGSERDHEKEIANEIYTIIAEYKLEEKIKIIKPRKDLNKIYNLFDIFVMPSITEGLSLSAIEAMLMKRICLFSDIPPFQEMINDGKNGFLFNSENVNDLKQKLENIIENIHAYKEIGENARIDAIAKYDSKIMCKEYEKLYINL